ncbi:MAG: TetR/AcrR family transcriptional regulator [Lachnotalea sp.]
MNKKDDIIKAALDEFGKNNYKQASVNQIIKVANTSKGNFYHYFKDKEDLYMRLVEDAFRKKAEVMTSINADDFFSLLEVQVLNGVKFAKENPKFYQLSRRFAKEKGNLIYDKVINEISNTFEKGNLEAMIEKSYLNLSINNEYPIEFVKKIVYYVFENLNDLIDEENIELVEVEERLVLVIKFLKNGLYNKK